VKKGFKLLIPQFFVNLGVLGEKAPKKVKKKKNRG
jgi:hypothetical protein